MASKTFFIRSLDFFKIDRLISLRLPYKELQGSKSKRPKLSFRPFDKNWRLPTLAEPIGLLPSAILCLTAVFGMGTGRTTALWPPKIYFKEHSALARGDRYWIRPFVENYTQETLGITIRELKS